jgi:predicted transcriptional regulator
MNNTESARIATAIRRMAANGKSQRAIATSLGISQATVSRVLAKDESEDTRLTRMIAKADKLRELYAEIGRAHDACDYERCDVLWNEVAAVKASL